jgi:hypothetical protein
MRRGAALAQQDNSKSQPSKDQFFEERCDDIRNGKLIPIIGDTIRNAHIFDYDNDKNLGVDTPEGRKGSPIEFDKLNVTEELTQSWAISGTYVAKDEKIKRVTYPLTDDIQIARVAQFYSLTHGNPEKAKKDYLLFLKEKLLDIAYKVAEKQDDPEEIG